MQKCVSDCLYVIGHQLDDNEDHHHHHNVDEMSKIRSNKSNARCNNYLENRPQSSNQPIDFGTDDAARGLRR